LETLKITDPSIHTFLLLCDPLLSQSNNGSSSFSMDKMIFNFKE